MEDAETLLFDYPAILKPNYEGSSMGVKLINSNPYLLEVTPLPALSETASFMMAAKLNNINPVDIFNDILNNACYRFDLFPKT